ncbi:MAG: hypothetical protein IJD95_03020 [Clostridia bacterium]|nr:hypothetical protein [Clostridia bacterium]
MKNLTPEMIEKAKAAKSVEELLALAKENEVEIPEEAAKALFEQLNPKSGELDDDDLDNVSGGGCGDNYDETKAQVGDHVYIKGGHTCIYCGAKDSAGTVESFCNLGGQWEYWSVKLDCCGNIIDNYNGSGNAWFNGTSLRKV